MDFLVDKREGLVILTQISEKVNIESLTFYIPQGCMKCAA